MHIIYNVSKNEINVNPKTLEHSKRMNHFESLEAVKNCLKTTTVTQIQKQKPLHLFSM